MFDDPLVMTFTVCHGNHDPNRNRWFIDGLPIKMVIFHGKLLNNQMLYIYIYTHR